MVEGAMAQPGDNETGMSYEEIRKQRVEENKKRMGELGLLRQEKEKAVKRPKLPSLEELGMEARRSSRNAGKVVTYSEAPVRHEMVEKVETRHGLQKQYLNDKARMAAIDAAEEVFEDIRNAAFIKPLLTSHTAGGFWMGLQSAFCKNHLPTEDVTIMLEFNDMEWECVYLAYKGGLSGGWRSFSIDNELRDGDCAIFELVNPRRFVMHIFRAARQDSNEDPSPKTNANKKPNKKAGKR